MCRIIELLLLVFFPSLSVHFQRQLFLTTRFVSSILTHMKVVFLTATEIYNKAKTLMRGHDCEDLFI